MTKKIPTWIMVWGGLMALVPLGFGLLGYFNAESFLGGGVTATGAAIFGGPAGFYISRNMATGLTTLFALSQRSASMLIVVFVLRIITDTFDFINTLIAGTTDFSFIFFASLLIGGSIFAITKLWGIRDTG